jgi:hypothetical protein
MMHAPHSPSAIGPLSVAVPGEIAGLAHLHEKYGKLTWAECLAPAIKLCDEGFELNRDLWDVSFGARLVLITEGFCSCGFIKCCHTGNASYRSRIRSSRLLTSHPPYQIISPHGPRLSRNILWFTSHRPLQISLPRRYRQVGISSGRE